MNKPQDPVSTSAATTNVSTPGTDYAAWVDREGREHLITRDMVDSMIAELIADADYSLQGRAGFNPQRRFFRYSQTRPHWGE